MSIINDIAQDVLNLLSPLGVNSTCSNNVFYLIALGLSMIVTNLIQELLTKEHSIVTIFDQSLFI